MNASTQNTAFVTSAWQRDWPVVLSARRFEAILNSHRHSFNVRLIVLNNFPNAADERRARKKAGELVKTGLATDVLHAPTYLTPDVLKSFALNADKFWKLNPYFSSTHLAALHWLQSKADWLFFQNGDVWLERPANWIPRALSALAGHSEIRGLNLCRNIYMGNSKWSYAEHCQEEDENLWIAKPPFVKDGSLERFGLSGFGLSDHAYLIKVAPAERWNFTSQIQTLQAYYSFWPKYAQPCFEMLYFETMERCGFGHAALKPLAGIGPVSKHKSFPKSKLKLMFYQMLGKYRLGPFDLGQQQP